MNYLYLRTLICTNWGKDIQQFLSCISGRQFNTMRILALKSNIPILILDFSLLIGELEYITHLWLCNLSNGGNSYLIDWLWKLNGLLNVKLLIQWLVYIRSLVNVSFPFVSSQWRKLLTFRGAPEHLLSDGDWSWPPPCPIKIKLGAHS